MKTLRLFFIPFLVPAFAVMVVSLCLCPSEAKAAPSTQAPGIYNQPSCCCPEDAHCPLHAVMIEKDHAIATESFTIEKVLSQAFLPTVFQSTSLLIKSFSPEISSHSPPLHTLQIETTLLRI